MAELADAPDSKSGEVYPLCGFDSHSRYQSHFRILDFGKCDYRIEKSFCGAVAQLGERHNGIVEARGSIPLSSTKKGTVPIRGQSLFSNH